MLFSPKSVAPSPRFRKIGSCLWLSWWHALLQQFCYIFTDLHRYEQHNEYQYVTFIVFHCRVICPWYLSLLSKFVMQTTTIFYYIFIKLHIMSSTATLQLFGVLQGYVLFTQCPFYCVNFALQKNVLISTFIVHFIENR